MIRNRFAAMLSGAAVGLLAMATYAQADDCAAGACCPAKCDQKCTAPCTCDKGIVCEAGACCASHGNKHCEPDITTVNVDHRCYNSKCEQVSFPLSPLLPSLFHGWKHKYDCAAGHCDGCGKDENTLVPGAKCGCEYLHKTLLVRIHHDDKSIYQCGDQHYGYGTPLIPQR